jgi:hypothetical protein
MTVLHHLVKQALHRPDLLQLRFKFNELALRKLVPSPGGRDDVGESEEQFSNLVKGKTSLPRSLNHR